MKYATITTGVLIVALIIIASMFVWQGIAVLGQTTTADAAAALDAKLVGLGKILTGIFILLLGIFVAFVRISITTPTSRTSSGVPVV